MEAPKTEGSILEYRVACKLFGTYTLCKCKSHSEIYLHRASVKLCKCKNKYIYIILCSPTKKCKWKYIYTFI